MLLCPNRPEGFGPSSTLHPQLPTTCFLDVIVEPLATWIFLLLIAATALLGRFSWRRQTWRETRDVKRRSIISRILSVLYYVLIVALFAMQSLEIARLVVAQLGIGLLPFTYVGILLALANHIRASSRAARLLNVLFFLLLAAALALKVAAEQMEQMNATVRRTAQDSGVQGAYPTSDEVLDNAVMLGVALVLALLEFVGWRSLGVR